MSLLLPYSDARQIDYSIFYAAEGDTTVAVVAVAAAAAAAAVAAAAAKEKHRA